MNKTKNYAYESGEACSISELVEFILDELREHVSDVRVMWIDVSHRRFELEVQARLRSLELVILKSETARYL